MSENESRSDKQQRVRNLRWESISELMDKARWIIGVAVVAEFVIFLFVNEQKEVNGPKEAYPLLYYIAVFNAFVLILITIMWTHKKIWGDMRGETRIKVKTKLEDVEDVTHDDADYQEFLEDI